MRIYTSKKPLIFIFILNSLFVFAQKTEIGGMIGPSYYWGDIVNNLQPSNLRFSGSVFVRYHLSSKVSLRGNICYARVRGADSLSKGTAWQLQRNLAFWTDIFELSGVVEYNLKRDNNMGRKVTSRVIPYVYGGIGVFHFNPKAINPITNKEVELAPLKTNGVSYSRVAACIPMGIGFRVYLNRRFQIGAEFGMRYSLSSYIDDVAGNSVYPNYVDVQGSDAKVLYNPSKTRIQAMRVSGTTEVPGKNVGERGKNEFISDVYFMAGVTLSYRIWPGQAIRCPRVY